MIIDKAMEADRAGQPVEAANLYEQAIHQGEGGAQAVANLLVIYWQSTSMGFYSHHRLGDDFVAKANRRFRELIDGGAGAFPNDASLMFWTTYISGIENGIGISKSSCEEVSRIDPNIPELYICDYSDTDLHTLDASSTKLRKEGTFRALYIAEIIDGISKRRKFANRHNIPK